MIEIIDNGIRKLTPEEAKFVENNIPLVTDVYNKKIRKDKVIQFWREDIIQEGYIGLCKAAMSFDASKGYQFSTWASRIILNCMLLFIKQMQIYNYANNDSLDKDTFDSEESFGGCSAIEQTANLNNIELEEEFYQKERLALIEQFLPCLSPPQQIAITCLLEGRHYSEITALTEWSKARLSKFKYIYCKKMQDIVEWSNLGKLPMKEKYTSTVAYNTALIKTWHRAGKNYWIKYERKKSKKK